MLSPIYTPVFGGVVFSPPVMLSPPGVCSFWCPVAWEFDHGALALTALTPALRSPAPGHGHFDPAQPSPPSCFSAALTPFAPLSWVFLMFRPPPRRVARSMPSCPWFRRIPPYRAAGTFPSHLALPHHLPISAPDWPVKPSALGETSILSLTVGSLSSRNVDCRANSADARPAFTAGAFDLMTGSLAERPAKEMRKLKTSIYPVQPLR